MAIGEDQADMSMRITCISWAILVLAIGIDATARPSPARLQDEGGTGPGVTIKVTGCVLRVADYLKGQPAAQRQQIERDQFVLTTASQRPFGIASGAETKRPGQSTTTESVAVGTSGSTSKAPTDKTDRTAGAIESPVYALTGDREAELALYAGHRVEVVAQPDSTKKAPGAGPASGVPKIPVITVLSFRDVAPSCQ